MRRADIEAVGDLAGEALAAGGGLVGELHAGIAARPFGILGSAAAPARVIHDGVSKAVYAGVRGGLRRAARRGAAALARRAGEDGPTLAATPAGSIALATLNGLYGNHLAERRHGLALAMELRRGEAVTPRLAVFVHGLFETDESWRHFPLRGERAGRLTYGDRLQADLGFSPVHVRYNTGLHISENGRELARQLGALVAEWPVEVEEIVLVGHSMGGLVARSACHYGEGWTDAVRHVFCLGTPHLGADLERGINALGWAFGRLPETRALGTFVNARSVGIKDLRYGACVEEDWSGVDPDEFLRDRCREVAFLPDANYYFIGARLSRGPVGTLLGDLLVRMPSASGRGNGNGRSIPFEVDNGHELAGLTHFDLLNHPAVYAHIRTWITRTPALPRGPARLDTGG